MHVIKINKNENLDEIYEFIKANGFGILVNQTDRLWATHIPLYLAHNAEGVAILQGHISKANPQWRYFHENQAVLAIFSGPHAYISSSWYDHENVPTWNYIAVHVYGNIKIIEGEALLESLKSLVHKYEAHSEHPVAVETMSEGFLKKELRGIVGFEITITDIHAAYKLSQNRDAHNQANIIEALEKRGDAHSVEIAAEMSKIAKKKS